MDFTKKTQEIAVAKVGPLPVWPLKVARQGLWNNNLMSAQKLTAKTSCEVVFAPVLSIIQRRRTFDCRSRAEIRQEHP